MARAISAEQQRESILSGIPVAQRESAIFGEPLSPDYLLPCWMKNSSVCLTLRKNSKGTLILLFRIEDSERRYCQVICSLKLAEVLESLASAIEATIKDPLQHTQEPPNISFWNSLLTATSRGEILHDFPEIDTGVPGSKLKLCIRKAKDSVPYIEQYYALKIRSEVAHSSTTVLTRIRCNYTASKGFHEIAARIRELLEEHPVTKSQTQMLPVELEFTEPLSQTAERQDGEPLSETIAPPMFVEPTPINLDPLALRVAWTPLSAGFSSFTTHRIKKTHPHRLEFKSTKVVLGILYVFLAGMVLTLLGFLRPGELAKGVTPGTPPLLVVFLMLVLTAAVIFMISRQTAPIVFDKGESNFRKGRRAGPSTSLKSAARCFCKLEDIYALQILARETSNDGSSVTNYELNLVLNDASRIHVIYHGALDSIRTDASILSSFLGKPVLDGTRPKETAR